MILHKIVFLDVCGTITRDNTTIDLFKKNNIKIPFFHNLLGKILWRWFKNDYSRKWYIKNIKGMSKSQLDKMIENYIREIKFNNNVLDIVSNYKKDGYEIILVTATIEPIAKLIASNIAADGYIASTLVFENNCYSGNIDKDLLDNKLEEIKKIYGNLDNLKTCTISDNVGDLSLMQACNEAIAVAKNSKEEQFWNKENIRVFNYNE